MKEMNFYLLPVKSFRALDESSVLELVSIISAIEENEDLFSILLDFYTCEDVDGITFNALYSPQNANSITKLLVSELTKCNVSEALEDIDTDDFSRRFVGFRDQVLPDLPEELISYDVDMLVDIYQESALHILESYSEIYEWRKKCYPELLFTEDAFNSADSFFNDNNKRQLWDETHKCMAAFKCAQQKKI